MRPLPILWQRLMSPEGETCDRCSATYQGMEFGNDSRPDVRHDDFAKGTN